MKAPRNEREFALANAAPRVPRPGARRKAPTGAAVGLLGRLLAVALGVAGAGALLVAWLLGRF